MDKSKQLGKLYSEVYLERGKPVGDSRRARNRIGLIFARTFYKVWYEAATALETRLGTELRSAHQGITVAQIQRFIESCSLRDFLDSITIIYSVLMKASLVGEFSDSWRDECKEVFIQENLHYEIDKNCGVHNLFDSEFQHQAAAAIAALEEAKYARAREHFEHGLAELRKPGGARRTALRSVFDAAETIVKDKYGVARLDKSVAIDRIANEASSKATNNVEREVVKKYAKSFGEWIEALHFYRHSQDEGVPIEPDLDWAIDLFSTGASYVRWLARL